MRSSVTSWIARGIPARPIQDLAVQFAVRQGEFARAYELRHSFDRTRLESATFRTQLALKREPGRVELYPSWFKTLFDLGRSRRCLSRPAGVSRRHSLDLEMGKALLAGRKQGRGDPCLCARLQWCAHKLSAEVALAAMTGEPQSIGSRRSERSGSRGTISFSRNSRIFSRRPNRSRRP